MELTRDIDVRRSYARDASGLELVPEAVARPASTEDVVAVVQEALTAGSTVTPAGAQTSTTAASISDQGILLSMRAMGRVLDIDPKARIARVEPGLTVGALNAELAPLGLRFAPDPTSENDATIGGAIACNASGARSLRYGATRAHVHGVQLVNAVGETAAFRRPALEKNTVGFHAAQDPVDWIVGSEGLFGVIVQAELKLVPLPLMEVGLAVPFPSEERALAFVVAGREHRSGAGGAGPQCLEFFDGAALAIARGSLGDERWMAGAASIVYLEQAVDDERQLDSALEGWLELAESLGALSADIAVYGDAAALRAARAFRHAVPAYMNERGASFRAKGGRKVSTDWAVPYRRLAEVLELARKAADDRDVEHAVTYGHAGNGHPHQNFIARDADELARIQDTVTETIGHVLRMGGTVAAEHGLGKLKRHWLAEQLLPAQVSVMRAMKEALDPRGMFAPGNVLEGGHL